MSKHVVSEPTGEDADRSGAPPAPPGSPKFSRWLAVIALAIALIAIALAAWALLRPPPASTSPQEATSQQVADAKRRACTGYTTVNTAVSLQTHADLGSDPVAAQAVAANARLSMVAGASYLLAHLDPATPPDLAAAMHSLADTLQDIAMNALSGVSNEDPAQAARLSDGEAANARVADLCK